MKASYYTAVGAMLIPLAVVLLEVIDNFSVFWASVIMITGTVFMISGYVTTIREENQRLEKERAQLAENKLRYKLHRKESVAFLLVLSEIANSMGVPMAKVARQLQRWIDEEKRKEDDEATDVDW